LVISDASSDNTDQEVRLVKDKRIKLFRNKVRVGKSEILNVLFKKFKTDYIVLFDADVIPCSKNTLENVVKPFLKSNRIGLVGGSMVPLKPQGFTDESIYLTRAIFRKARKNWKGGDNIFGCEGGLLALSSKFAKKTKVPSEMIANDRFLYLSCLSNGYEFKHVELAGVWYKLPTNIKDHIKQSKRFLAAPIRLEKFFPGLAAKEQALPKNLIYKEFIKIFLSKPLPLIYIYVVNRYCELFAKKKERFMSAKWDMAETTKSKI
jgi:cellulose synthase/poly-beta-1,6-N-acetylglucosamine synthase-like glycosyltransferase